MAASGNETHYCFLVAGKKETVHHLWSPGAFRVEEMLVQTLRWHFWCPLTWLQAAPALGGNFAELVSVNEAWEETACFVCWNEYICAFIKIDSWMVPGSSEGFTAVFISLFLTVKWLKCRISVGRAFNYSQMLPVAFDVLVGGQSYD